MHKTLIIEFLTEWQVSSGIGDGYIADNKLARDNEGFLYIPGRAVKGALREGATLLSRLNGRKDLVTLLETVFGTESQADKTNQSGCIRVGNAHLDSNFRNYLNGQDPKLKKGTLADLITHRAQTKLTSNKQVAEGSLRKMECAIPFIQLETDIDISSCVIKDKIVSDAYLEEYLMAVCAAVKSIGGDRARGLGKCKIYFKDKGQSDVKIPAVCKEAL